MYVNRRTTRTSELDYPEPPVLFEREQHAQSRFHSGPNFLVRRLWE